MKFISVLILLICLFAATFSQTLIYVAFEINQNYIAQNLCINRNNPNSNCNGHCYLAKQLSTQEKQTGTTNSSKEKTSVVLYFSHNVNYTEGLISFVDKNHHSSYSFCCQDFFVKFFHPPATV